MDQSRMDLYEATNTRSKLVIQMSQVIAWYVKIAKGTIAMDASESSFGRLIALKATWQV